MTTTQLPKVGEYLETSWGYDQTNVDFYRVMEHTPSGKNVRLQPWSKRVVSDNGPQVMVVPGDSPAQRAVWAEIPEEQRDPGNPWRTQETIGYEDEPVFLHRSNWRGTSTTVNGHYAKVWDGTPSYQTGSGWGH